MLNVGASLHTEFQGEFYLIIANNLTARGSLAGLTISGGDLTVTDDGNGNAVITVDSTSEILTAIQGQFGNITDADFI